MFRNSLRIIRLSRSVLVPAPLYARSFSCAIPRFAKESDAGFQAFDGPSPDLYSRLHSSPRALEAMEQLSEIIKIKTGVSLRDGDSPSLGMMTQLANDPDLKAAAMKLMNALRDSGIEVDPRQAFEALKVMGGSSFDGVGELEDLSSGFNEGDGEGEDGDGKGKK